MKTAELQQSSAYKSLLALTPSYPEEFLAAVKRMEEDFEDEKILADQTLLCVGRCHANDIEGEEITVVTLVDNQDGTCFLQVHNCTPDGNTPTYAGHNSYQSFGSMVRMQDSVLSEGESWCGQYERDLFGRLAEEIRS